MSERGDLLEAHRGVLSERGNLLKLAGEALSE
jgi:hypothetical protein